jgi:hypothetical protein
VITLDRIEQVESVLLNAAGKWPHHVVECARMAMKVFAHEGVWYGNVGSSLVVVIESVDEAESMGILATNWPPMDRKVSIVARPRYGVYLVQYEWPKSGRIVKYLAHGSLLSDSTKEQYSLYCETVLT